MTQTINSTSTDYNAILRHEYETIRKQTKDGTLPLNERIEACERACVAYVIAQDEEWERKKQRAIDEGKSVNTVPIQYRDAGALDRLADVLMHEYLTWSHPDNMSIVEDPVLSDTQRFERFNQIPSERVYYRKEDFVGSSNAIVNRESGDNNDPKEYPLYRPNQTARLTA